MHVRVTMRKSLIVVALLGFSTTQCSKSEDSAPKYPDVASFCAAWALAECNDSVVQACAATSKDLCTSNREAACQDTIVAPATTAGLSFDFRAAEGCVNQVGSAYSDAKITSAEEQSIVTACGLVFSGTGAKGTTCNADSDCKQGDGLRCILHPVSAASDAGVTGGTCQMPQTVQAGQSCSAADARCADGYHCGSSLHCDSDGKLGEQCDAAATCATGLKCASTSTCAAKLADGTACATASDCTNGMCLTGANLCASVETLSPSEPFCVPLHQ